MNEQDQKAAIEKANAYRQMTELWAWKDFKSICDLRGTDLINGLFNVEAGSVTPQKAAYAQGGIKTLEAIFDEVRSITSDKI